MDVYDKAEALAKALMNTPQYNRYNELVKIACRDEGNRRVINEYLALSERYQAAETGVAEELSEEEIQHFEEVMERAEAIPDFAEAIRVKCDYEDLLDKALNMIFDITEKGEYRAGA